MYEESLSFLFDLADAGLDDGLDTVPVGYDDDTAEELYAERLAGEARTLVLTAPDRVASPWADAPATPPGLTRREAAAYYEGETLEACLRASNVIVARLVLA